MTVMYIARPFAVDDDTARALLNDVSVGQLVTATAAGPLATFVPWVVDLEAGSLLGHVARPNPQWSTPTIGNALVIAHGPHGYVSPSCVSDQGIRSAV
jgi:transcriptional regulator